MANAILHKKRGLIFGALDERSIAWHVATRCLEEGADIVLTNTGNAIELGEIRKLAEAKGLPLLACDATDVNQIRVLLKKTQELLGGKIDFILHAVAQSVNLRRHLPYERVNYEYFKRTLDISSLSLHKILSIAMAEDAIAEYGSVVTLSFIASERFMYGYNDMSDAKALLESIVRQMGAVYGEKKKVRVNIVSQSATHTKAGDSWDEMEYFYKYTEDLSPIGNADADDCADVCVTLFSDFMKKVTMQTIYNDGGFGRTMLTEKVINSYRKSFERKDD
ncbi:MAG: SDR family oxidoreductase [Paludibacteraceae bacterium]|nr:SDR family oxidoreductase [Paludibacteraceae bacterium]